ASSGGEFLVVQLSSTRKGEAVGASDGDVTGGVLVEERVVEKMSAFADGGGGRDERHFAEVVGTFVGFQQFLQGGFPLFCGDFGDTSVFKVDLEIFNERAAIRKRESGGDD